MFYIYKDAHLETTGTVMKPKSVMMIKWSLFKFTAVVIVI